MAPKGWASAQDTCRTSYTETTVNWKKTFQRGSLKAKYCATRFSWNNWITCTEEHSVSLHVIHGQHILADLHHERVLYHYTNVSSTARQPYYNILYRRITIIITYDQSIIEWRIIQISGMAKNCNVATKQNTKRNSLGSVSPWLKRYNIMSDDDRFRKMSPPICLLMIVPRLDRRTRQMAQKIERRRLFFFRALRIPRLND